MNSNTQYVTSINVAMAKSTNQTYPIIKTHITDILNISPPKEIVLHKQIKKQSQKNIMNLNDSNKTGMDFRQ